VVSWRVQTPPERQIIFRRSLSAIAASASGTLIRNTSRQLSAVSTPPSTGPSAAKNADPPGQDTEGVTSPLLGPDRAGDRDRRRHHHRRRGALNGSHADHPDHAPCPARQSGRDREQHRAAEKNASQPEQIAQSAAKHHERRERQDVRGQNPLAVGDIAAKPLNNIGARERHRGLIHKNHAAGQGHRHQRQPHAPSRRHRRRVCHHFQPKANRFPSLPSSGWDRRVQITGLRPQARKGRCGRASV
jgi:hypothetical protein